MKMRNINNIMIHNTGARSFPRRFFPRGFFPAAFSPLGLFHAGFFPAGFFPAGMDFLNFFNFEKFQEKNIPKKKILLRFFVAALFRS